MREPRTSFELCLDIFGDRLSIHQLRFALAETIAHLVYLENEGRIEGSAESDAAAIRYAASGPHCQRHPFERP